MEDKPLLAVYENAWNVFYGQHAQTGRNVLRSLEPLHSWAGQHDGSAIPFEPTEFNNARAERAEPEWLDEDLVPRKELEPMDRGRLSWFVNHGSQRQPRISKTTIERPRLRCSTIKPGPKYESVDVLVQNLFLGENDKIFHPRVLPYGDDPAFNRAHGANFILQHGPLLEHDGDYPEWAKKCRDTRPFASTRPDEFAIEILTVMQAVDDILPDRGNRLETEHKELKKRLDRLQEHDEKCRVFADGVIPSVNHRGILSHFTSDLVRHWSPLAKYHKSQRLAVVASLCHTYAKLDKLSLSDMTRKLLKAGCNRPACLHAFCESHPLISTPTPDRREAFIFALRSLPRKARLPTNALTTADIEKTRAKTTPCGHECFLYRGSETDANNIIWEQAAEEDLAFQVAICPDLGPCDIASIVAKPCCEVYAKRKGFEAMAGDYPEVDSFFKFKPMAPKPPVSEMMGLRLQNNHGMTGDDAKARSTGPHEPCDHSGPCTSEVCSCYRMNGHCDRACGCDVNCKRRFAGCTCCGTEKKPGCGVTSKCPCRMLGRDCEIGICVGLHKKHIERCRNMVITNDESVEVIVYDGAFGYGIFAKTDIRNRAFLGLYVGEVLKRRRSEIQEVLAEHTHRNYLFELHDGEEEAPPIEDILRPHDDSDDNASKKKSNARGWQRHLTVDSAEAGNSTRFANHDDSEKKLNAVAEHHWVQGDVVLAFYSTKPIKKHAEIMINYGQNYFKNLPSHGKGSSGHAMAATPKRRNDFNADD